MALSSVSKYENKFFNTGAMTDACFFGKLGQTQFWDKLVYENHKADGSDESSQKWSTEHVVQKA